MMVMLKILTMKILKLYSLTELDPFFLFFVSHQTNVALSIIFLISFFERRKLQYFINIFFETVSRSNLFLFEVKIKRKILKQIEKTLM